MLFSVFSYFTVNIEWDFLLFRICRQTRLPTIKMGENSAELVLIHDYVLKAFVRRTHFPKLSTLMFHYILTKKGFGALSLVASWLVSTFHLQLFWHICWCWLRHILLLKKLFDWPDLAKLKIITCFYLNYKMYIWRCRNL